ncbi:MAG: glycoside hydrolase family 26 protein [Acidimicrobiia bacterium]
MRARTLIVGLVAVAVSGIVTALPALAQHEIGEDPAAYGEPHAGWVAAPRANGRLAPATGALLGVHPEDSHTAPIDAEHQKIIVTEERLGRHLDINNTYYQFTDIANEWEPGNPDKRGLSPLAFWDIEMGRIPLVGWACGKSSEIVNTTKHDETIRKTAEAMKAFGHEFFMRYCWEMDGSKRISEVGDPEMFVASWIKIHGIFQQMGVTNVVWVWCGNANTFKYSNDKGKFAWDYYPGDQYVDWVSADGYNWGAAKRGGDRWRGMVEIFDEFMVWARSTGAPAAAVPEKDMPITGFPRKTQVKPIMIGEYGAIEDRDDHQRKAAWMRDAHDTVNGSKVRTPQCPNCGVYSDIAALVYFDINADKPHQNGDWRILSSTESEAAYKEASDDPWFRKIHTVGWSPARNRPDAPPTSEPVAQPPTSQPPITELPGTNPSTGARAGYWVASESGEVHAFGDARHFGDDAASPVRRADIEATPTGNGYWILAESGAVSAKGDATLHGSAIDALLVGEKAAALSATLAGAGYWIFTDRGRVLPYGDATHLGDLAKQVLNGPVLDSIRTASGRGYYMVGADGGIFAFGDATFFGSMGGLRLNAPVQSLVPDLDGSGYWLVASDGGVFAFDAPFRGSMAGTPLNRPMSGMVPYGNGYLMVAQDGGVFVFSDLPFAGSLGSNPPARPMVSVAALQA